MNIPESELTPEKCRELRQGGALKVMINLLHAHTAEPHGQSEADFDLPRFLSNFNQYSKMRKNLTNRIRKIILRSVEIDQFESEVKIIILLDYIRTGPAWFYDAFSTDNQDKLIGSVPTPILNSILELANFVNDPATRPIVEQFGGVYAILDLLRAQTRLHATNREFVEIDSHYRLLKNALTILRGLMQTMPPQKEIQKMLGNCRSFHELLVGIIMHAHDDGKLELIQICCDLIYVMYIGVTDPLTFYPDGYMSTCGVVRCLAELFPQTDDLETVRTMLDTLRILTDHDKRNVMQFYLIDNSTEAMVNILKLNGENLPEVFEKQKKCVRVLLSRIMFGQFY